jgi:hypothetical protein
MLTFRLEPTIKRIPHQHKDFALRSLLARSLRAIDRRLELKKQMRKFSGLC